MTSTEAALLSAQILSKNVNGLSESELVSQLEAILETNPEVVHEETHIGGHSLLHDAAQCRSPEYCKLLVNLNPNLVKISSREGLLNGLPLGLPIHHACWYGNVETAKYLYHLYPESINIQNRYHDYPLQSLLIRGIQRDFEEKHVELARFLLKYDQGAVSSWKSYGTSTLHNTLSRRIALVKLIFDAYPQAIHVRDSMTTLTPLVSAECLRKRDMVTFFRHQINLEQQAREDTTPDNNGQLPIHRAVQSRDTSVGGIKLMMAANPASIGVSDSQGQTLLHLACQGGNVDTVKYIVGLYEDSLNVPDLSGNFPLHHACMGGNCDVIPHIIEQSTFGATLQNSNKQIPIQLLLFESECDRDSMEYIEAVRCLFQVNPVDTLKCLTDKDKSNTDNDCVEQGAERKRKRV